MSSGYATYDSSAVREQRRREEERLREQQRQARVAALRSSIEALEQRVDRLRVTIAGIVAEFAEENPQIRFNVPFPPGDDASESQLENHLKRLREELERAEREARMVQARLLTQRTRRFEVELSKASQDTVDRLKSIEQERRSREAKVSIEPAANAFDYTPSLPSETLSIAAAFRARVERVLNALPGDVDSKVRLDIVERSTAVFQASSMNRAEMHYMSLQLRVADLVKESREREKEAERALALLGRIADIDDPDSGPIRERLKAVVGGRERLSKELEDEVAGVYELSESSADLDFVRLQVSSALAELGYEQEPEMATLTVEDGVAYFRKPTWRNHRLKLMVHQSGRLATDVVRLGDPLASRSSEQSKIDTEIEAEWCDELEAFIDLVNDSGIGTRLVKRTEPGQIPMQVVATRSAPQVGKASEKADERLLQRQHKGQLP